MSSPPGATREEARAWDAAALGEFGVPGAVLMENAGREVAAEVLALLDGPPAGRAVAVFCGRGNNGGDGFVAARHLRAAGADPSVWLADGPPAPGGDAAAHLEILKRLGVSVAEAPAGAAALARILAPAAAAVDALFGTGLKGRVGGRPAEIIRALNFWGGKVVAVDIPSGLDADTGQVLGSAVSATATVTFVRPKAGFAAGEGPRRAGRVRVALIGLPARLPPAKKSFEP